VLPDDAAVPIAANDRVSDVIARDEALIEVFVRHAPQFSRLRHRSLRRIMARLVTVEQAARMGGVSLELLLRDLNSTLTGAANTVAPAPVANPTRDVPPELLPRGEVVELDVRDDLRSGREPFSRIMAAVASLRADQVLLLRAIFEPVPLFAALAKRGFAHAARQDGADDWSIWFWRPEPMPAASAPAAAPGEGAAAPDVPVPEDATVVLDVRGLEPPEPLLRTLAALESLPVGHTLLQVNARIPQLLLPMLAERGFACDVDESRADQVLVRIWRPFATDPAAPRRQA